MSVATENVSSATGTSGLVADEISRYAYKSWDELFAMDRREVEDFQLRAARRRFEQLAPRVAALKDQAEQNGVTRIDALDDLVPLLFNHTVYKSYPMSLLEKSRFGMLTEWLQRSTTIDLSGVDVGGCQSIDDWMGKLEAQTPLQIFHTTGTTGKLSFIPRTTLELDMLNHIFLWAFSRGFGNEPSAALGGSDGIRLPVIFPSMRNGRYVAQRVGRYMAEAVASSPDQFYTLNNGTLSADLVSLSGRIRVAQAKGELSKMVLPEGQRLALKRYLEELSRRPQEMADFFENIVDKLRGRRVFIFSQGSYLFQAAAAGLGRNISSVFAADSVGATGGGSKDVALPGDWREQIKRFTGIPTWRMNYGMSEIISVFPMCPHQRYHLPVYAVVFLLDPQSSASLPRHGTQTGRFAMLDLLAQTYWGGIVSSDMATIEWDTVCPCGRKGAFVQDNVTRYAASVTGDDKITCSATIDNTDAALQKLLAV